MAAKPQCRSFFAFSSSAAWATATSTAGLLPAFRQPFVISDWSIVPTEDADTRGFLRFRLDVSVVSRAQDSTSQSSIRRARSRTPNRFQQQVFDAQTPLEKVLQHRGAHARVFRRTQPYAQGHLRPIYCDTESYDDGCPATSRPSIISAASSNDSSRRDRYSSSFCVVWLTRSAGGTLARATRLLIRDSPRPATTYEQKTGGADGVKGA